MGDLHGILVLNKPKGMTSHDCVAKIRRLAKTRKVGHTGTLDPEVTGVLPICIGQATKVAEYLLDYEKEYIAEVSFGRSTRTEDQVGEIIEDLPLSKAPSKEQLEKALATFLGPIKQVPPMYSAVKVKGKKLYELAREGKEIDRQAREVHIYELKLLDYNSNIPYPSCTIQVRCSKGTYIRTLGVDIGKHLGYPAHLSSLVRNGSGPFCLQDCSIFEEIETWKEEDWYNKLYPLETALAHLPKITLQADLSERVQFGQSLVIERSIEQNQLYRIYDQNNQFLAIYTGKDSRVIKPKKVFLK